ncbi:MAG: hypothetical protein Q4A32_11480, partial [Lachnospiraceae bacterium]|nr:hypothetical protein [Lachnospiraceae bacterium]
KILTQKDRPRGPKPTASQSHEPKPAASRFLPHFCEKMLKCVGDVCIIIRIVVGMETDAFL